LTANIGLTQLTDKKFKQKNKVHKDLLNKHQYRLLRILSVLRISEDIICQVTDDHPDGISIRVIC